MCIKSIIFIYIRTIVANSYKILDIRQIEFPELLYCHTEKQLQMSSLFSQLFLIKFVVLKSF